MVTVSQLDFEPRTRGRAAAAVKLTFRRELGEADIALLASGRGSQPKPIARLRDRHHALARCLASGMTDGQASAVTGYDPSRISILKRDPSFCELLSDYKKMEDAALAEFQDRATTLTLTAMDSLQEALEDEENPVPVSMVLEIAKFGADRTGHAPVNRNINLNANMGGADRLAAARQRLARLTAPESERIVDVEFKDVTPTSTGGD